MGNIAKGLGGATYAQGLAIYWSGLVSLVIERNSAKYGGALYLARNPSIVEIQDVAAFSTKNAVYDGAAIGSPALIWLTGMQS